ncbi:hypothetical protein ACR77J_11795 [Tissierella praeacuta]|uniref:hypothetical protein n=1 Tax=Tissierella praeacuta TaxID=43131 RepID=UPI003DA5FE83
MSKKSEEMIEGIKKYFNENGTNRMQFTFNSHDNMEKKKELEALEYLEEKGYIEITSKAIGFYGIKLTTYFIDNIDNL